MRLRRNSIFGMVIIVGLTLIAQLIILSTLFQYLSPPAQTLKHVSVPVLDTRHHPRNLQDFEDVPNDISSLVNMRSVKQSNEEIESEEESEQENVEMIEETMVQRKRSKEVFEDSEKAPKQYTSKEKSPSPLPNNDGHEQYYEDMEKQKHQSPADYKDITGLKQATIRNNPPSDATHTTAEKRRVLNRPSKKTDVVESSQEEELMTDWQKHQLKIIKSNEKLKSLLARSNPMDSYRNSLKIPGFKSGESIKDYVTHIQSLGKSKNIESFTKDFCNITQEKFLECSNRKMRKLSSHEEQGRNILFTIRTSKKYHETRLSVLFETWVTTLYPESLFLVTDDEDPDLAEQLEEVGMHYINTQSGQTHNRLDLCCKAGVEIELMFQPENEHFDWFCHVDDDMYVHVHPLAQQLSKYSPRTDPVYLGRSGSEWDSPYVVNSTSKLGKPGQKYHFAVGGMYCLSRAMLELAKPYLVGCGAFSETCNSTQLPEDVTIGLVTGAVLRKPLTHTQMIWTHGMDLLTSVPSPYLREMIAISHGFGSGAPWMPVPNVAFVPGALFSIDEDITQFKSIHCYIYPTLHWCVEQKKALVEEKKKHKKEGVKRACICSWQTYMCCEIIRSGYLKTVIEGANANTKKKKEENKNLAEENDKPSEQGDDGSHRIYSAQKQRTSESFNLPS